MNVVKNEITGLYNIIVEEKEESPQIETIINVIQNGYNQNGQKYNTTTQKKEPINDYSQIRIYSESITGYYK